jgi:hypothetical protein
MVKECQDGENESGQDGGNMCLADRAAILTERGITPPVTTILDVPVGADKRQELGG